MQNPDEAAGFAEVLTAWSWWDAPREGVVRIDGRPYRFRCDLWRLDADRSFAVRAPRHLVRLVFDEERRSPARNSRPRQTLLWLMRCATTLLTVVLLGCWTATATAATASVQVTGDGKVPSRIWSVVYRADPGERNMLKVGTFGATLRLDDSGAIIRAGSGCVSIDDHAVRCTAPTQDAYLYAEAGDEGDYIYGSLKDDVIRGGPGDDFLDGGPGRDYVDGEDGNDVLRSGDGTDRLFGGPGDDEIRLNRARPLGGPLDYARGGPYICSGGMVIGARAYDEIRACDRVSYGLAATSATPRVNSTSARLTLTCPTPKDAGRGHCTGRIGVRGRRSGDAQFDIRAGHTATVVVRLRRGRMRSALYGFVISGTGRYLHRRYALKASWSVNVAYLKPNF